MRIPGAAIAVVDDCTRDKLAVVGGLLSLYLVVRLTHSVVHNIRTYLIAPRSAPAVDLASFGSWAVVTGATDGLGKQYAFKLARHRLNVALVSRSPQKLDKVAKEIESVAPGVKTRCVVADFRGDLEVYDSVSEQLADIDGDIAVLVNSVGVGVCPDFYLNQDDKEVRDSIVINCFAVSFMTKMILRGMVERRKGVIVNLSSLAGVLPTPLSTIYSGTKAYIDFFSRSLQMEYGSQGIIIQCVTPAVVSTALNGYSPQSLVVPDPQSYVDAAFATIGRESRTPGCWPHAVFMWILTVWKPDWLNKAVAMKVMMDVRQNILRAREKLLKAE